MMIKVVYSAAAMLIILQPEKVVSPTDEAVGWIIRGIITLGLLACAYLLREAANTMKSTKDEVGKLAIQVATHQVMFEHWLATLTEADIPDTPARRITDKILADIIASKKAQG